ncbi:MAG: RNA polymerase sigma factor [Salibacteraceae bacterium]
MITEDDIKACVRQNKLAQRKVYEAYFPVMLAIVRRYIRDEEDVMDVLDQGYVKIFKKIDQYHFENSFEGWCKRIVINTALDHLRSNKRYKDLFSFDAIMPSHQVYNDGLNNLSVDELMEIIDQISPISKVVFNLFAIDGFSHKEIADKLSISVGTSKWHLSSARKQIQSKLKAAYPEIALLYG